jgi:hypothetical protein
MVRSIMRIVGGEDNHPPHAGFGHNPGPALRLRRELAGRFFRSLIYLTCPVM